MEEQANTPNVTNWLEEEAEEINKQATYEGEKLPSLQFEEGRIVEFEVDFSKKFAEYNDQTNKVVKAIIPVTEKGVKKILWLNKKNPLYGEMILAGKNGQNKFKVIQIGSKANTKYNLVRE